MKFELKGEDAASVLQIAKSIGERLLSLIDAKINESRASAEEHSARALCLHEDAARIQREHRVFMGQFNALVSRVDRLGGGMKPSLKRHAPGREDGEQGGQPFNHIRGLEGVQLNENEASQ